MIPESEIAEVRELRRRIADAGEGELVTDADLHSAWRQFCESWGSHWLVVDDGTFANFVAWMIGKVSDERCRHCGGPAMLGGRSCQCWNDE